MIEIPEAFVLASQIDESLSGKIVDGVEVPENSGKFSFYLGDQLEYRKLLISSIFSSARAIGGMVEIWTTRGDWFFMMEPPRGSTVKMKSLNRSPSSQ